MSDKENKVDFKEAIDPISWVEFLQEHPPGSAIPVTEATGRNVSAKNGFLGELNVPELQLYCPEPTCNSYMFFNCKEIKKHVTHSKWTKTYLTYWCKNCGKYNKTYSIAIIYDKNEICQAYKFGELPNFGPPLPSKVIRLIQPDRELFLSGRRCENQGLGIGAFTYYRRVVENQWGRLIGEIIKVGKAINSSPEIIDSLEKSKDEKQFSKAVKTVTKGIPATLLINGQNPLLLLHGALSQGVHNLSDEECLGIATSIRIILVELAEKLGSALKDEKELNEAVKKLLKFQADKRKN